MNTNKEKQTTSELFLKMTADLATADRLRSPAHQLAVYRAAMEDAITIINRLALFGGAVFTCLIAVRNVIESLKASRPKLHAIIDSLVGKMLGFQDLFLVFYNNESKFCTQFEDRAEFVERYNRSLQYCLIANAGADPKVGVAALKTFDKVRVLTQPANTGN